MSPKKAKKKPEIDVDMDVLISEVQARPQLWDKAHKHHCNRSAIQKAWEAIATAMFDNFVEMSEQIQDDVVQELRTKWKSTRDYFIKLSNKNTDASGSSPSKPTKHPYDEQLQFLVPSRKLRPSCGNYQAAESCEPESGQPNISSTPSPPNTPIEFESTQTLSSVPSETFPSSSATDSLTTETTSGPSLTSTPVETPSTQPLQRRSRKTLRIIRDKQLEVESEALALIRRVDGNDETDYFGYTLASRCRDIPNPIRQDFMSFCLAAASVFGSGRPLPPVEDCIKNLKIFTGERAPSPTGVDVATQTHEEMYHHPSSHHYTTQSGYYPTSYQPQSNMPRQESMELPMYTLLH